MSNPMPPRPPAHPTRRQLDELEALMQRMLALPVVPLDDEPTPGVEAMPALKPSATAPLPDAFPTPVAPSSSLAGIELDLPDLPPEPQKESGPSPAESPTAWPAVGHYQTHLREEGMPGTETVQAMQPTPVVHEDKATFLMPTPPPDATPDPDWMLVQRRRRPRIGMRLVVRCNRMYDRWAYRLGPTGRWLRQPQGRALVGWTGVLLLASALAWGVLDWMGWTW